MIGQIVFYLHVANKFYLDCSSVIVDSQKTNSSHHIHVKFQLSV
jgi:hypothetical protein